MGKGRRVRAARTEKRDRQGEVTRCTAPPFVLPGGVVGSLRGVSWQFLPGHSSFTGRTALYRRKRW